MNQQKLPIQPIQLFLCAVNYFLFHCDADERSRDKLSFASHQHKRHFSALVDADRRSGNVKFIA